MKAKFIFVKSEQGNMTGMKENQSTKGTLRRRRTNKQVQADILSAVGRILQKKDFTHITLMDIAREAKTDPNVVLRQFGSLEQVFDCYIRTIDYWMHDLFGNKALKRGERSALERMFARMDRFSLQQSGDAETAGLGDYRCKRYDMPCRRKSGNVLSGSLRSL